MFERDKNNGSGFDAKAAFRGEAGGADTSKPAAPSQPRDVAVIGSSIQINGDLRGNEDLRIEGDVSGTVKLENSALTIGKSGKVKAGVYAKSIAVDGETTGDLHATDIVTIHENARVRGNIIAPRVSIVEGAHFQGSIEMDPEAVDKALGTNSARKATSGPKSADIKAKPEQPASVASPDTSKQAKSA